MSEIQAAESVRDSIVAAMTEIEDVEIQVEDENENEGKPRDEKGKFKAKEKEDAPEAPEEPAEPIEEPVNTIEAPQALSGPAKAKWKDLPPEIQQEWSKRENDIHKMMTAHDGELRMGREMKEVISPYMPIIVAEGGNPVKAVQSLLNTAYLLRTGTPEKKAQLVHEIAQTYGVDLGMVQAPEVDPVIGSLQQEISQLKQFVSAQQQTQGQQEEQRYLSEIQAFAADPKNLHFEQVKSLMAPLLASGQAKDLQEAYDMACHASPTIRSTLLAAKEAEKKAKRNEELAAKKQAAVSVVGSPGVHGPNTAAPKRSVREELEASFDAAMGSKI